MSDENSVREIQKKYGVKEGDAYLILHAASNKGVPVSTAVSFFKLIEPKLNAKYSDFDETRDNVFGILNPRIQSRSYGNKLKLLEGTITAQKAFTETSKKRPKLYGDDLRTQGFKIRKSDVELDEENNPLEDPYRYVSLVNPPVGTTAPIREIVPRFYYYNVNGTFVNIGHSKPPAYDPQFMGHHEFIPFAEVKVTKITNPKRLADLYDESGRYTGTGKRTGEKIALMTLYMKDMPPQSETIKTAYSHIADEDAAMGLDTVHKKILPKLNALFTLPQVQNVYKTLRDMRRSRPQTIGDASGMLSKEKKAEEMNRLFEDFYGKDYKERKRKLSKPPQKRKVILKKKPVKKCTCSPLKRKTATTIKRKVIRKVKRK